MQTEEKRENIEEKKEERMEMPVSGALERGAGKAPVSGAEISVHDTENGHPSEDVYILAIESSCDETAASVVKNGRTVLSNIISSQIDLHTLFGGVVPEIASRKHIEKINQVIEEALTEAHMSLEEMTAIAVTYGPGLVGALLVGVAEAKALITGLLGGGGGSQSTRVCGEEAAGRRTPYRGARIGKFHRKSGSGTAVHVPDRVRRTYTSGDCERLWRI